MWVCVTIVPAKKAILGKRPALHSMRLARMLGTFVWKEQSRGGIGEIDLRQRWKMASQALMWERKALPRPCPSEAPFTRPAMSVTLRNAGTLLKCREAKLLNPSVASRGDC